jgi:YaiO family outer membrane protein
MYGIGLGKYTGNWYFRWRTLFIPSPAKLGISNRVIARYYFAGTADDYMEINGGFSQGGEYPLGSTSVESTRGQWFGVALQKYFYAKWGIVVTAGYDDENNVVEQSFTAKNFGIKGLMRW